MLAGKLPVTGLLTGMSFVLILAFSIPLGIFTARHAGGRLDRAMTAVNQALMAIPAFLTGILLTYAVRAGAAVVRAGKLCFPPATSFGGSLWYLFCSRPCPSPCPGCAMTVKMLRSSILSELQKDYVRTSHSRGNSDRATLYRHVLRNAMGPVVIVSGHDRGGHCGRLRGHRAGILPCRGWAGCC